jgi:prepilin-type N-terminal cleavage/methylation domain-containing protein
MNIIGLTRSKIFKRGVFMKKKGFTLIELLAVIVILAIILAIAIPGISGMIKSSTKSAFESDAKMVLKAAEYKKLEDSAFKEADVNQDSINELLGLSNDNYLSLKIALIDNIPIVTIVGKNKWNGLIACGSYTNIKVVEDENECGPDLIPPVITMNGDATVTIGEGETYTDSGAIATDNRDGDITSNIVATGSVNSSILGTYTITYAITDKAGNISTLTRTVNVIEGYAGPNFKESKGVNGPNLADGMVPVKWDGTKWVDTSTVDTEWYNYDTTDRKWANARTADGSMWVWIPRYVYKISSGWHTSAAGIIEVQFSKGTNDNWNSSVIGSVNISTNSNTSNNKFTNHPAFDFGSTRLTGIWVAKFEATAAEGVANSDTEDNVTTKTVKIIPNVQPWRYINIGNMFTVSRNMETNSIYGWGTTGTGIDTHLMKNTEWGVAAYLSKSQYGKNTEEVWINNGSPIITGCAGSSAGAGSYSGCQNAYNTANGVQASTTGNIYGIYDMSGGSWEYVSAYIDNGSSNLRQHGLAIINADSQYKNLYAKGTTDNATYNYPLTVNQKGDAIYETSNSGSGNLSWFNDASSIPYTTSSWFVRGGYVSGGSSSGMYYFTGLSGYANSGIGFRPVLAVNTGL